MIARFRAAQQVALEQTEAHEARLAEGYAATIRKAGRRAARQFRIVAVTREVTLAAIEDPFLRDLTRSMMQPVEDLSATATLSNPIVDAMRAAAGPPWTIPPVSELVDTVQVTRDLLEKTAKTREAAARSATEPIMSAMGVSFSLQHPMVQTLIQHAGVRAVKLSIPGLRDVVQAALTEAFEEGLSVPQTANLIETQVDGLATYQATMLARTDLVGTANGGSLIAAKAVFPTGLLLKRWVNATDSEFINDGRIRPTHLAANGQQVPLDGPFIVGGSALLYPGDPSGPDDEICGCRCTITYVETDRDLNAAGFDETRHPRFERGVREGGRFRTAAQRAREAKALRDGVENSEPEVPVAQEIMPRREVLRQPTDAIPDTDRMKARRALSYTSDDDLLRKVQDAKTWDDLSQTERSTLARHLEDLQDDTDHEGLQPIIDRLKRETPSGGLPPRGSYPVTGSDLPPDEHELEAVGDLLSAARPDVTDLAMVAVYPRPEEQQALAVEGGNDPDTMHITLVFLGDAAELDEDAVTATLDDISRIMAPLEGTVGGVGMFREGEDGIPVIALPSVKGLAELRALVADALADQGIRSPTEHGWTPHLTLEYVDPGAGGLPNVPDVPLHFDSITFSKGDVRRDFPLEG